MNEPGLGVVPDSALAVALGGKDAFGGEAPLVRCAALELDVHGGVVRVMPVVQVVRVRRTANGGVVGTRSVPGEDGAGSELGAERFQEFGADVAEDSVVRGRRRRSLAVPARELGGVEMSRQFHRNNPF